MLFRSLCTTCNHVGVPAEEMRGRRDVEEVLWVVLAGLTVLYFLNLGILEFWNVRFFRGTFKLCSMVGKLSLTVAVVYTLFRVSTQHQVCTKCHASTVIPVDSPRAREILKGQ